jgi:hypothetical protein
VNYVPRQTANREAPPELVQVDGDLRFRYRYASERDGVGEVSERLRAAPGH